MRQAIVTLIICGLATTTFLSGLTMAKTASSASGTAEDWTKEVLDLEKVGVCTKDSWTHIWNDPEGAHKDFPAKHLSRAEVRSGGVEVTIPWRFAEGRSYPKAGAPNHYMQYVYLKDESNNILAIQKFEHSDTAFPWVFPSSNFQGAKTLTPYSIDCIHGVWKGDSITLNSDL